MQSELLKYCRHAELVSASLDIDNSAGHRAILKQVQDDVRLVNDFL